MLTRLPMDTFSIVTVVVVWGYSIGVVIVIAIVYALLNKIAWLDNLGRKSRSVADTQMENIMGHLAKLAIEHENDGVRDIYKFVPKISEAEADDE